jgi:hypothetical protein
MSEISSFLLDVDIADSADECQVIFAAQTKAPFPVTEIERVVDAFVSAANLGMFSKVPTAPTKPIVVDSVESQRPEGIRYVWKVTGIQVGDYRVLLNMLEAAHHISGLLERISLVSTLGRGSRMNSTDLLNAPFSIKAGEPPFSFRSDRDLADCREPVIRLEFQRNITDDELSKILPLFLAWDNVVIRGGYLEKIEDIDDDLDIEASLASQQTYLASPNTVEHLFYDFVGQEAAFDALINMAIKLHYTFCPLASFEIE